LSPRTYHPASDAGRFTLTGVLPMKRFWLLPLAAVVFAVACTDATAPANSHALLTPQNPALVGDPPPPPADVEVYVNVDGATTVLTGTYFSNGGSPHLGSIVAATELNDPVLAQTGTAWLRFDHDQPAAMATANARVKRSELRFSGNGTIQYGSPNFMVIIDLNDVDFFGSSPVCSSSTTSFCADIVFRATVIINGVTLTDQRGEMFVFNSDFCNTSEEGCFFPSAGD